MFERISSEEGRVRLHLKGSLEAQSWTDLGDGLRTLAEATTCDLVLDLTNVRFIDGPGIAAIAFLFKRLVAGGRRLTVAGVSGQPLAMLRDHGLTRVLGLPQNDDDRTFALRRIAFA